MAPSVFLDAVNWIQDPIDEIPVGNTWWKWALSNCWCYRNSLHS